MATENFEKESIPEYGNFWGISPFTNTRITPNSVENYDSAIQYKNNDRIGILLEYRANASAVMRFTINDVAVDVEIDGMSGVLYPVVSFMSSLGSATLIQNPKIPANL